MVSNGGHNWRAMESFGVQVLTGRWFMVFASLLIMSMSGATYMFGLYSGDIKSSLGYDQTTLNLLGFFKDLGGNVGIISGLINEISPPWVVLTIGAVMNLFGYLMIWLATTRKISKPPVWQMCAYICIGANSQTFANTGALVTCVKNFPESRGVVIGLLKGFVGLSGAILAQLYRAFYGHDSKGLILLIGWLPAVVSFVFLRIVRVLKVVRQENELKVFYKLLFMALGLASFLMIMIILQNILGFSRVEYVASASIVVILLIAPLVVVFKEDFNLWKNKKQVLNDSVEVKVITQNPSSVEQASCAVEPESLQKPEVGAGVPQKIPGSCRSNIFRPQNPPSAEQAVQVVELESLQQAEAGALVTQKKPDSCRSNAIRPQNPPLVEQAPRVVEPVSLQQQEGGASITQRKPDSCWSKIFRPHNSPSVKQAPRGAELESLQKPEAGALVTQRKPDSCWSNIFKPPERGEDYTILQALFSIDMLILFTVTIFGVGGTLTAIDNLGQIGKSLGYPAKSITTFISLVSIWNFLGRVTSGFVSEIFLAKYKFPRPLMLTIVLLISCSGHLLIAFGVRNSLYIASIVMGFCFGAQWPLIFAIISEIFGLKYYSTLLNAGGAASPVGAYILNVRVAGYLYDKEALKQLKSKGLFREEGQDLSCIGVECYKLAFLILTAATFFACIVSLILVLRTRNFYKGDIYKKFREQDGDVETKISMVRSDSSPLSSPSSRPATVET